MAQQSQQIRVLYCQRFNCPPEDYAERAFRKCLYAHAKPLTGILRLLNSGFFSEDIKFIEALGTAVDMKDVRAEAASFHDANRHDPGFLRTAWKLRVSGRKAMRLARKLISIAGSSRPEREQRNVPSPVAKVPVS
jgi:hypothetical protein